MTEESKSPLTFRDATLLAVWPGAGQVGLTAGSYIIDALGMRAHATIRSRGFFDVESVDFRHGVLQRPEPPRSHIFGWRNPEGERDLLVMFTDRVPSARRFEYCRSVLKAVRNLGAARVYTVESLVSPVQPADPCRVLCVASESDILDELSQSSEDQELLTVDTGSLGGIAASFLAAAQSLDIQAVGMLAQVPAIGVPFPYLKATHAVLESFLRQTGLHVDLTDLNQNAALLDKRIEDAFLDLTRAVNQVLNREEEEEGEAEETDFSQSLELPDVEVGPVRLSEDEREHIESLFAEVAHYGSREKAVELKNVLDEHGVFEEYEDRFLDLFSESA